MARRLFRSAASESSKPKTRIGRIGNGHENNKQFRNNAVKTSKYSWYNFLILNLLSQFRRVANVYFLIQGILMSIGWYYPHIYQSPVNPWSTIGTLIFVLSVTLVKDGIEDGTRHASDARENNKPVTVVRNGKEVEIASHLVRVGDWIRVINKDQFPADMVAVLSSDSNNQLFVETANIDGETNLKIRKTVHNYVDPLIAPTCLPVNQGYFECDLPNKHIHHFSCTVNLENEKRKVPASYENFLLRGSVLRNTAWVYGFVVYTGLDTKVMKNMTKAPSKLSQIERTTNRIIFIIFFTQLILVIVSVIISVGINNQGRDDAFSGGDGGNTVFPFWLAQVFAFFILYGQMVPISLYVTMEMVNLAQGYFVNHDIKMMHVDDNDGVEEVIMPECRDSKLCQEIGQIEYVFSDKTGTLTRNVMEFKKCAIGGKAYDSLAAAHQALMTQKTFNLEMFFQLLAVCHTVIPDYIDPHITFDSETLSYKNLKEYINYEAESPDEGALVEAAAKVGFAFMYRTPSSVLIMDAGGKRHKYDIIAVNAFNSTRKRMSVVVRNERGEIFLLCKGADNMIFAGSSDTAATRKLYDEHLTAFANEGLRTLLCAVKKLSQEELSDWMKLYKEAELMVSERDEALAKAAEIIERNMSIVGATAIEDKLQEGVPETIANLADAGVKLWVLTGDKMETAINIGYGSKILTSDMRVVTLKCDSAEKVKYELEELQRVVKLSTDVKFLSRMKQRFKKTLKFGNPFKKPGTVDNETKGVVATNAPAGIAEHVDVELAIDNGDHTEIAVDDNRSSSDMSSDGAYNRTSPTLAIVIDGPTFKFVSEDASLLKTFWNIGKVCKSVIACRVSPAQKAEFVKLFKRKVTLAIGDGANDVSMIQAAQIGVGIKGKEGRQAVNSSDFAIGQFRFLERLLLLHGRWNYRRMAKVILVSFYKNAALVFTLFIFNCAALMSGVSLYDSFVYAGFNFFTGMPPLLIGIFDKDLSEESILRMPVFYSSGREGMYLNYRKMTQWMIRGLITSLIVAVIPIVSYITDLGVPTFSGQSNDISGIQAYGTFIFTTLFFAVMFTIGMETLTWNGIYAFFFFGSYLFYICVIVTLSNMLDLYTVYYKVADYVLGSGYYWLHSIFIATIVLLVPFWLPSNSL
mmetsp:Transcript_17586/g.21319  ORF Transcript_17586/g.21319 Transcript_17586/m.21319 type:complete len:1142 (-) Transcript_17586:68-3493(-)